MKMVYFKLIMSQIEDLNTYRKKLFTLIAKDAYHKQAIILSSGKKSPYYIDARVVTLSPEGAYYVSCLILSMLKDMPGIKAIGGPTIGADPIVGAIAAVSFQEETPLKTFIIRKSKKAYGKRRQIEGPDIESGSSVVIVDDVATTGSSLVESVKILQDSSLIVKAAIVIVDREEGAGENLAQFNVPLKSLFKGNDFLNLHA
ncbi:MAG: orotate phosphoribosyltransferase [Candidatus Omnitrophica bacterium]|nr:orotate phosphoribosyltransferase [Candidatus Omnitrophota bacterium]